MTIAIQEGSWRNDIAVAVNTGVSWSSVNKAFVYQNGEWKQFFGPGIGTSTISLFTGGNNSAAISLVSSTCVFSTFTTAAQSTANLTATKCLGGGIYTDIFGLVGGGCQGYTGTAPSLLADNCPWGTLITVAEPNATFVVESIGGGSASNLVGGVISGNYNPGSVGAYADAVAQLFSWSTVTTTLQPSADLTTARCYLSAASISTFGIYFGGYDINNSQVNITDTCSWSTYITASQVSAQLTVTKVDYSCGSDRSNLVLIAGGQTGSISALSEQCNMSTLTTVAAPSANLSVARFGSSTTGDNINGIIIGGFASGTPQSPSGVASLVADKCNWSTFVTAAHVAANLAVARGHQESSQNGVL